MTKVLIVSKTQMNSGVCVGGIVEETCEFIRLHNEKGGILAAETPFQIGDRWILQITTAWNKRQAPHIEDKQIVANRLIENIGTKGIIQFIQSHNLGNRLVDGRLEETFESCLCLQGTKNFINKSAVPNFSTQFWITDKDLVYYQLFDKHYYMYGSIRLKYVGYETPISRISQGTIVRLSLANWWNGDGSNEERCYLQLSGWYI